MNKSKLSVVRYYKKKFKKLNVSSGAEQYSEILVKVLLAGRKNNGEHKDRLIESMQEKEKEKRRKRNGEKQRAPEIMGAQVNTPI